MDRPSISTWLPTLALLALGLAPITGWSGRLNASLRNDGLNTRDHDRIERGYYERLITPEHRATAPLDPGVLATSVDDVREYILKPNLVTTHKGATWTTSALGIRDRPYDLAKPPGAIRVALVGDSIAIGWGVDDGQGFEPLVERAWRHRGRNVEVLNFAVPGHAPGQRWEHFSRVGWATDPDLVIVEATLADLGWDEHRLRVLLPRGIGFDAPVYADTMRQHAILPGLADYKSKLRPERDAILAGVYHRIVADCQSRGVPVVWVFLPRVGKPGSPENKAKLLELAKAAGFAKLVDLSDAFDGLPPASLAIEPGDFHPNQAGHAILARRLDPSLWEFVSSLTPLSRRMTGEIAPRGDLATGCGSLTQQPQPEGALRR